MRLARASLTLLLLAAVAPSALARQPAAVRGAVSVTNKGISLIPSFTLGRPAAIFDLSVAKGRHAFEPQIKYGLSGKPWTFVFWWRTTLLQSDRAQLRVGAHPALAFRTTPAPVDGIERDIIEARRYVAGELAPTYTLSRRASLGPYYLYAYGVEPHVAKHTHYLALRGQFAVDVAPDYVVRVLPQAYYLSVGSQAGFYLNSALSVSRKGVPFSLAAMVNKPVSTRIDGGEDLIWNVTLVYAFRV